MFVLFCNAIKFCVQCVNLGRRTELEEWGRTIGENSTRELLVFAHRPSWSGKERERGGEEVVTEAQRQLKELLGRQMDTSTFSLQR